MYYVRSIVELISVKTSFATWRFNTAQLRVTKLNQIDRSISNTISSCVAGSAPVRRRSVPPTRCEVPLSRGEEGGKTSDTSSWWSIFASTSSGCSSYQSSARPSLVPRASYMWGRDAVGRTLGGGGGGACRRMCVRRCLCIRPRARLKMYYYYFIFLIMYIRCV